MTEFPALTPSRPSWLVTLADLALLLVGFFVLVQATHVDRKALADGFRKGFGAPPQATPMPVAAAGMMNFAAGSAMLPDSPDALVAWAREAVRDPRVTLTVTGATDGSRADVDPQTGSAAVLAADRARAVGVVFSPVAPGRLTITTAPAPSGRHAMVTLAFAGDPDRR